MCSRVYQWQAPCTEHMHNHDMLTHLHPQRHNTLYPQASNVISCFATFNPWSHDNYGTNTHCIEKIIIYYCQELYAFFQSIVQFVFSVTVSQSSLILLHALDETI